MTELYRDAETEIFTIPAGETENFAYSGVFVRCFESDGDLKLSLDRGSKALFRPGFSRRADGNSEFTSFQLHNESASDVTVIVGFGYGDIEDNSLQVSGIIKVDNPAGEVLDVSDATAEVKLDAILAALQGDDTAREPITDTSSATYAEAISTSVVLATAVANTNGVLIKTLSLFGLSTGATLVYLEVNGNEFISRIEGQLLEKNILLPPNVEVKIVSTNTSGIINAYYEVL